MSKGDNPRPLSIPPEEFEERWEQTFGCYETRTDNEKCHQNATDNENCHGSRTDDTLRGTTCWYCECGEVLDGRTARTHECKETEDE